MQISSGQLPDLGVEEFPILLVSGVVGRVGKEILRES